MDAAGAIRAARRVAGLTQAELAARSGTSQATVSAYEHGTKTPAATTLARVLAAAGWRLTVIPAGRRVRTPSAHDLADRGRVLTQVLDLAERLPSRRRAALHYPRLGG